MSNLNLTQIHQYCSYHRKFIEESKVCGCFYCLEIFEPKKIVMWVDREQTAICPYCTIDSVLPDNCGFQITKEFLSAMKKRWFG